MNDKNINGFLALFFVLLILGYAFHQSETFAGSLTGHLIGIAGMVLMLLTLVYPFKKRVLGRRGRQNPITIHIFYGLMGPSLLIIHSAHKLDSLIGVLTFLVMLIVVLSGITGRYLFRRVNRTLKDQQRELSRLREIFHKRREEVVSCRPYFGLESGNRAETEDVGMEEERQDQCEKLYDLALSISELEYSTTFFDSIKSSFSKWMKVHHILTIFLFSLAFVHILTVLYYGLRWL
ncbi:MAG: hypothetical protein R6V25_13175 [Desulfatiglandales bacterium]